LPTPHRIAGLLLATCTAVGALSARASDGPPAHYVQTNLVSDTPGMAAATDPHLVNPWGLSVSPRGAWWVADNGTGLSTLYNGAGAIQSLVVTLPSAAGSTDASAPTGTVFNGVTTDFLLGPGQPAHFLFATEGGTIVGWNAGTAGVLAVNRSGSAVYKGLALASQGGSQRLYAANFQTGAVDVFDARFQPVSLATNAFRDPLVPANFAPFNVQAIGASIYVTYAQKEAGSIDEVHGPGKGFVAVFAPDGTWQRRLRWGAWFNAPWGVALAPAGFGGASNRILVGQFGSGRIASFDANTGEFKGNLRGADGRPIMIDGLWALAFGNGAAAGPTTTLYFTAGIDDEAHGLFGTLTAVAGERDDDEGADGEKGGSRDH
jgi:uncharacterized protein (TIGR03118 family)